MTGQGITNTTLQMIVVDFKRRNRKKSFLQLFFRETARLSLENAELLLRKVVTLRRIQNHAMS